MNPIVSGSGVRQKRVNLMVSRVEVEARNFLAGPGLTIAMTITSIRVISNQYYYIYVCTDIYV